MLLDIHHGRQSKRLIRWSLPCTQETFFWNTYLKIDALIRGLSFIMLSVAQLSSSSPTTPSNLMTQLWLMRQLTKLVTFLRFSMQIHLSTAKKLHFPTNLADVFLFFDELLESMRSSKPRLCKYDFVKVRFCFAHLHRTALPLFSAFTSTVEDN